MKGFEASTLPSCITFYPNAIPPNNCGNCPFRELCKKISKKHEEEKKQLKKTVVKTLSEILSIIHG